MYNKATIIGWIGRPPEISQPGESGKRLTFSILGRIVVVETTVHLGRLAPIPAPFSILGRIVVVETRAARRGQGRHGRLSVSSDGSWWLKLE